MENIVSAMCDRCRDNLALLIVNVNTEIFDCHNQKGARFDKNAATLSATAAGCSNITMCPAPGTTRVASRRFCSCRYWLNLTGAIRSASPQRIRVGRVMRRTSAGGQRIARGEVVVDDLGIYFTQPADIEAQKVRIDVLAVRPPCQELKSCLRSRPGCRSGSRARRATSRLCRQGSARQSRRIAQGEFKGNRAAHRMADQHERWRASSASAKPLHHLGIRADRRPPRAARFAVTGQVERIDRMAGQPPQFARPVHQVAARAMHEHQRRTHPAAARRDGSGSGGVRRG